MLNHSIIGCGRIAPNHVDAFQRLPHIELVAVVDKDATLAQDFATKNQIPRVIDSYESLLADESIDSISLCVPHYLHVPMATQALQAGKHVLIEKPPAISMEEIDSLHSAAEDSSAIAMPVIQHRHDAVIQLIGELIKEGALGRISLIRGHLECFREAIAYYKESAWRGSWELEGGSVLINQAFHVADMLLHFGGPVESVFARMGNLNYSEAMDTEDTLTANIQFASGALGVLSVIGSAGSRWSPYIELIGSKGLVAFDISHPNQVFRITLEDRARQHRFRKQLKAINEASSQDSPGIAYYGTSHREVAQSFQDAILGKPSSVAASLDEALDVARFITTVYTSARTGNNENIPHNELITA
ncbi:MAG: Gfo/Idh/MocA family oxidoreductase [Verrucomicrobiota bacterium]